MKKLYTFCKNLLPAAALLFCCTVMPQLRAQDKYSVFNSATGLSLGSYTTLNLAVANCVPGDSCIITLLDNDALDDIVEIPAGYKIALKSEAGHIDTIWNSNNYDVSVTGSSITLENIILTGTGDILNGITGGRHILNNSILILNDGAGLQRSHSVFLSSSVLIMNGGKISNCVYAVQLQDNSTFMMYDGEISECFGESSGVSIDDGVFEMYGGFIRHNSGTGSASVILAGSNSEFKMYGGEISDNLSFTGGVALFGGIFTMDGTAAKISNNKSMFGGGVTMGGGTFNMYDGRINHNKAEFFTHPELAKMYRSDPETFSEEDAVYIMTLMLSAVGMELPCGGGVGILAGKFNMYGGSITDNSTIGDGGGIYTVNFDNVTVAQDAVFSDNTAKQAAWLEQETIGGYDPGAGEVSFVDLKNVIHPAQIATSTRSNPPAGKAPFMYLYNNYDINMVGAIKEEEIPVTQVCPKDSISLVVNVVNNWDNPFYQWILNGEEVAGANDTVFKYKPKDIDTVQCKVFAYEDCADEVYSQIMVIELLPKPTLNQPQNIEVCAGETIGGVTFEGNFDEVHWVMSGTAVGLPTTGGTGNISSFTAANNSSTGASVATITATPISGSCEGESKTFTITVNPKMKLSAKIKIKN